MLEGGAVVEHGIGGIARATRREAHVPFCDRAWLGGRVLEGGAVVEHGIGGIAPATRREAHVPFCDRVPDHKPQK